MKRILLAEDDEFDFDLLLNAMSVINIPFSLDRVTDGEKLLSKLKEEEYDLIFLDVHLPRIDGYECLNEIRKRPELNGLPVIIITTANDGATIHRFFAAGAHAYFSKSYNAAKWQAVLKIILAVDWKKQGLPKTLKEFVIEV